MDEYLEMLVKLAHENPQLKKHLMPVFKQAALQTSSNPLKTAGIKTALAPDTEQFIAWCVMKNDKWTPAECQRVLDRIGVPLVQGEGNKRGPLTKGEMVKVQAATCANAKNADLCHQYDGYTGVVTDVDGDALVVTFDHGKGSARFDGVEPGKKTGLGRHTPVSENAAARATLEVVYISEKNEKPPSKLSLKLVEDYIAKGLAAGESRSDIYHTGQGTKQAFNKSDNTYFFGMFSQQRDLYPRNINPQKGQLLYVGLLGKRPGGWKAEFAQMLQKQMEDQEDKD